VRSGREGSKQVLRDNLEIKKKLKQAWIIFFQKNPSPTPFSSKKWSLPNKSVTTTKEALDCQLNSFETSRWNLIYFLQIKYITCFKMFMRQYSSVLGFFRGDNLISTFLSETYRKLVG
jgi:hypothetical protein